MFKEYTLEEEPEKALVNVIQETKDYTIFKHLPGNRQKHSDHTQNLMLSFTDHPSLRQARPILVNEYMQVVDGQHSLEACERLGISAFYMMVPGLTINETRVLNALQKGWELMDYAKSYASTGHKGYQFLLKLSEDYPLTLRPLATYAIGKGVERMTYRLRMGNFELLPETEIYRRLDMLKDFAPNLPTWYHQQFALAFHTMQKNKAYNHERMMHNLGTERLQKHGSIAEYMYDLELIYNKNTSIGNHVRFV
jgi:hypothetical protein